MMGTNAKGQVIRTNCKRCGVLMLKWERNPRELEVTHPYPFDKVCGHCLTRQEGDFYYNRGRATLSDISGAGSSTQLDKGEMNIRVAAALARYETSGKVKRGKRKSIKLFSVDEPQRERAIMKPYETRKSESPY